MEIYISFKIYFQKICFLNLFVVVELPHKYIYVVEKVIYRK